MAGTEPQSLKRKKPPTFRHLPVQRAKKLKETWVTNAKIKSKWKAQKRKEAALQSNGHEETPFEGIKSDDDLDEGSTAQDKAEDTPSSRLPSPPPQPKTSPVHSKSYRKSKDRRETNNSAKSHDHRPPKKSRPHNDSDEEEERPSLRDLTREAYSKNSLHTFKAGRGRGGHHSNPTSRGRGNGRGGMTGRGQPDMKLRMNAMLERIKQSVG